MTPRQMSAYLFLADRRHERDLTADLSVSTLAASGDTKAINKQMDTWDKGQ